MAAFASILEILTLYAQRNIVEKHVRLGYYHASAEAIASMICVSQAECILWCTRLSDPTAILRARS